MKDFRQSFIYKAAKNFLAIFKIDVQREIETSNYEFQSHKRKVSKLLSDSSNEIQRLETDLRRMSLKNKVFAYAIMHKEFAEQFREELNILSSTDELVFPYQRIKRLDSIEADIDSEKQLPYVVHCGKRLYFPRSYSTELCKTMYRNYIESENIVGGGYRTKCPHQYQSDNVFIGENDIMVDIGCAEALLSLEVIEKVKKVYLVESNPFWNDALQATFSPYTHKVVFINKMIADTDSNDTITLETLLKDVQDEHVFIKMDIEGCETDIIENSANFIKNHSGLKFACCTYHKDNDANRLEKMFVQDGYKIEFSSGYMLFFYDQCNPPYFRKGVIRAWK